MALQSAVSLLFIVDCTIFYSLSCCCNTTVSLVVSIKYIFIYLSIYLNKQIIIMGIFNIPEMYRTKVLNVFIFFKIFT